MSESGGCEEGNDGVSEVSPCGRFVRSDEVLGKGAFKVVYKGFDQVEGIEVAWCQISISGGCAAASESMLSEAFLMKSLEHENITKCHSWWVDHENMNINMITEFFSSGTLRQYRNKHKSVNIKAIRNWGKQILEGLHYLHTHDPLVVHRDLKCDNIYVNGNSGRVKIGDLGMAAFMREHCPLRSVVGTPEFMAPELYDEEYHELVDVYSFGMCMLELITNEYPYCECNNVAQIFKKVTTGVKPLSLGKVNDSPVKGLIEKCLAPAAQRPSVAELLKDAFFLPSKKGLSNGISLPPGVDIMSKSANVQRPDSHVSVSIGSSYDDKPSCWSSSVIKTTTTPVFAVESSRSTDQMQLRLRGKRIDGKTVSFTLHIANKRSHVANCLEFDFDLLADDALKIALEMVEGKDLTNQQVPVAVELIDSVLLELEPSWLPWRGNHNQPNVAYGCRELRSNWQFSAVVHLG